jgi:hypothetical protein
MNIMSKWARDDRESARAWVEKSQLSEQMRKMIEPYLKTQDQ